MIVGKTRIPWAKQTWNIVTGCSPVSAGCAHCWARRQARRLAANSTVKHRERYEGFRPTIWPERLPDPLHWREPQPVFPASQGDLFHDDIPDWFRDDAFAVMALTPHITYMLLTKRVEQMRDYITTPGRRERVVEAIAFGANRWGAGKAAERLGGKWEPPQKGEYGRVKLAGYFDGVKIDWPLKNVWAGATVEDQPAANARTKILLETPAALHFLCFEPLLGYVDIAEAAEVTYWDDPVAGIRLAIAGCETGPRRRHVPIEAFRSLRDQCVRVGIPFFLKQMEVDGRIVEMPELDGRVWDQMPEDKSSPCSAKMR